MSSQNLTEEQRAALAVIAEQPTLAAGLYAFQHKNAGAFLRQSWQTAVAALVIGAGFGLLVALALGSDWEDVVAGALTGSITGSIAAFGIELTRDHDDLDVLAIGLFGWIDSRNNLLPEARDVVREVERLRALPPSAEPCTPMERLAAAAKSELEGPSGSITVLARVLLVAAIFKRIRRA